MEKVKTIIASKMVAMASRGNTFWLNAEGPAYFMRSLHIPSESFLLVAKVERYAYLDLKICNFAKAKNMFSFLYIVICLSKSIHVPCPSRKSELLANLERNGIPRVSSCRFSLCAAGV